MLITIFLVTFSLSALAQTKESDVQQKTNWKRIPTYYVFGVARPSFVDTAKLYGFKIKFKGCLVKNSHLRRNKKTIKILNERFGENWFEENIEELQNCNDEDLIP